MNVPPRLRPEALLEYRSILAAAAKRVCPSLTPDELDEVVQRALIRVQAVIEQGRQIDSLQAYLYRVGTRIALDMLREAERRQRLHESARALPPEVVLEPTQPLQAAQLLAAVEVALQTMPERRAQVLRLHLMGYEPADISQCLGHSWINTRNLLYRGLRQLKAHLRATGYDYVDR